MLKAKISLARAVYSDSDIYLLDDPLSSVDEETGQELFENCIINHLSNKCVILVTHRVQLLKDVEKIIVMNNGRIIERGSYNDINEKSESSYEVDNSSFTNFRDMYFNNSSSLSSISLQDIRARMSRIERISSVRQDLERDGSQGRAVTKVDVASSTVLKRENREYIEATFYEDLKPKHLKQQVSLKDWWQINSLGVGNIYFFISIALAGAYAGLFVYVYIVLGRWARGNLDEQQESTDFYLYAGLIVASTVVLSLNYYVNCIVFYSSSKNLHNKMIWKILRAPLSFYDSNSVGSIITRFTKDIKALGKWI